MAKVLIQLLQSVFLNPDQQFNRATAGSVFVFEWRAAFILPASAGLVSKADALELS